MSANINERDQQQPEEIGLKQIPASIQHPRNVPNISEEYESPMSIGLPPSDPPHGPAANTAANSTMNKGPSPPAYYLPNSPTEMFLVYEDGQKQQQKRGKKGLSADELEKEKQQLNEMDEESGNSGPQQKEETEVDRIAALNRRQTRLYRCLVWTQFSMTVFTCIFIMIIMVLVAVILVMLQRTIDRADHAIRDNPVSQMYMKLKNAVGKIPG